MKRLMKRFTAAAAAAAFAEEGDAETARAIVREDEREHAGRGTRPADRRPRGRRAHTR